MTTEERLRDTLQAADSYTPSPDLFAKVQRSITEDRAHRRRVIRIAGAVALSFAIAVAWILVFAQIHELATGTGDVPQRVVVRMPWWALEVLVNAVMAGLVVVLGPLIRRFGRTYVEDVFRTNRGTGDRFLALLDIAYYLIFAGYIVLWMFFEPSDTWRGLLQFDRQVQESLLRIGGLLLLMGVLHAVTIFVLPFVGLVFAAYRHRTLIGGTKETWEPEVRRAHRAANIVLWVIGVLLGLWLAQFVFGLILTVIAGLAGG